MAYPRPRQIPYPSHLKLVRYKETWRICFKARGKIDGRPVDAWLVEPDGQFFCEVCYADQVEDMPEANRENFFGDQFVHAIDMVDAYGKRTERMAGASNIYAARAAFFAILHWTPNRRIMLRHGSHVILSTEAPLDRDTIAAGIEGYRYLIKTDRH
ncbi:hypothetical protein [Rhizobium sp. 9140]|uniref:hypothetical protein n=1 Tax=Rhizobium sp. 9140 TaxID=1761900 RepID=UPI00079C2F39|nr:hypothetical protein [Rhizobium sp. 9140]CZT36233.1 hypothetical protein GA0004734_00032330 [Rhizobium sp. 9140]